MKTFERNKNAEELGIDTSREFVVVKKSPNFNVGEIIIFDSDHGSFYPYFSCIKSDIVKKAIHWYKLAYADSTSTKTVKLTYKEIHKRSDGLEFSETHIGEESIEELKEDRKRVTGLLTAHRNLFKK